MGTGRIGGQTSIRTAKDAGVTFRLKKSERKRLAKARRDYFALTQVKTLRGEVNTTPRLVKKER